MVRPPLSLAAAALLAAVACSNVDGPVLPGDGDAAYFPNGDGSRWVYRCQRYFNNVPLGEPYDYNEAFEGDVAVGDTVAQRFVRGNVGADAYDVLLLADDDENAVTAWGREFYAGARFVDAVYFEPPWSHFVYPLRVNYSWLEAKQEGLSPLCLGLPPDLDDDGADDTADVEVVRTVVTKEDLTLPSGTFEGCYKIRRTIYATYHMTSGGDLDMTYVQYDWFKPAQGFVQYTGDEITVPNGARYTFLAQLKTYHVVTPKGGGR